MLVNLSEARFSIPLGSPRQWSATTSIVGKTGCAAQTLHTWPRQAGRDQGRKPGPRRMNVSA